MSINLLRFSLSITMLAASLHGCSQFWNRALQHHTSENQAIGFHCESVDSNSFIYGVNLRSSDGTNPTMGLTKYQINQYGEVNDSVFSPDRLVTYYGSDSEYNTITRLSNGFILCTRPAISDSGYLPYLSLFNEQMDTVWTKLLLPAISGDFSPAGSLPLDEDKYVVLSKNNHNASNTNGFRITIGNTNGDLLADNYYDQNPGDFEMGPKNFILYGHDSLLMWGQFATQSTFDWGVFALKTDVNATSASYLTFGNPDQCPESLPDATMLPNNSLLMAYGHCQGQGMNGFPHYEQLHLVEINPTSMSVVKDTILQMPMLDTVTTTGMHVQKLITTTDGGILILLTHANSSYVVSSYLVRLNVDFDIEWMHKYELPLEISGLEHLDYLLFDVMQLSDNGFLCTGDIGIYTNIDSKLKLWGLRIDACGELIFSNCSLTSHTEELKQSLGFELWPNPSAGMVLFRSQQNVPSVNVLDLRGAIVATYSPKNLQLELDLSHLATGLYIVRTISQNDTFSYQKLVISR